MNISFGIQERTKKLLESWRLGILVVAEELARISVIQVLTLGPSLFLGLRAVNERSRFYGHFDCFTLFVVGASESLGD